MSKDGQVARARKELARELHIDESQVTVKRVKETEWPDASLGIEARDTFAAQVLVPGYIIELQARGQTYTYHSDENTRVVRV